MKQFACLLLVACSTPLALAGAIVSATIASPLQSADALVQKGRALLEQKKPAEALAAFEEADKLAGGGLATRQWVLRARLDLGQVDSVLSDVEKLESQGQKGAAIDYLYGMCFAARAQKSIAEGGNGGIIAMAFADSASYLKSALKAEPKLYPDGWRTLAESAWNAQDLPAAREAADTACALAPEDDAARTMLGKVCFSQYSAAKDDEARKAEAAAHLEAAREAFEGALRLCVARKEPEWRASEAGVRVELARVHAWKGDKAAAAKQYGAAFGLAPQAIDIAEARGVLDSAQFVAALEAARDSYAAAWGVEGSGDAGVWWWLGYARYADKQHEGAEEAFAKALAKWPDFVNSHYYIAMSRYFRQDYDGAVEWFHKHHLANAADCAASLSANKEENIRILDYLIGLLVPKGKNLEASWLARIETTIEPANSLYWNNLGLFLRDAGEQKNRSKKPEDKAAAKQLWEEAYTAYAKALELAPKDPNYLNDIAVMLHYYLDRDLDKALGWYRQAAVEAEKELARTDLTSELKQIRAIAKRDANNNLKRLEELLELRRKKAEEKKGGKKDGDQQGEGAGDGASRHGDQAAR